MIGQWMETLQGEALERIADAPLESWHDFVYSGPCRCLLGHANDFQDHDVLRFPFSKIEQMAEARFLAMNDRYPLPSMHCSAKVTTMIQNRARRILASRSIAAMQKIEAVDVETIEKVVELANVLAVALQRVDDQPATGEQ